MRAELLLQRTHRRPRLGRLAAIAATLLFLTGCGTEAETPEEDATTDPSPTATLPASEEPAEPTATPTAAPSTAPTPSPDAPAPDAAAGTEDTAATEQAAAAAPVPASAQPIVAAVDATLAQGSAGFSTEVTVDSPDLSDTVQSSGAIDFAGRRRQVDLATRSGELRSILSSDGLLISLGDGMGWVRADPAGLRDTPPEAFGLTTLPVQDPTLSLALLRGATADVQELGGEDLDGEATTHYRLTADVGRAAAAADGDVRGSISALGSTVDLEVWIDGQGRVRRVLQRTPLQQSPLLGDRGLEGTLSVTVDLFDFGQPVDISEPSDAEVLELDESLLQQLVEQMTAGVQPAS